MTDPVTRRAHAVRLLVRYVEQSGSDGRNLEELSRFLVKCYEYGLRRNTAVGIIRELDELGVLYRKGSRFYVKKT